MSRVGLEARDLIHDDGRRLCPPPQRVNELTGGQSLESNIALVCSNAEARSAAGGKDLIIQPLVQILIQLSI